MQYRSAIGGGLVFVGVLLAVLQGLQYLEFPAASTTLLFNTVPFILVSAAIVFTGVTIIRDDEYGEYATLVISWGIGSAVAFVAVFTLITGVSQQDGLTLLFGAADAGSAGGLAGLLIGLYDAQSRQTLTTVERSAEKLKGLNKYGKVLNESSDVESVSALCIEVLEFVLDSDGAVFVHGDDEGFRVVDTTLPDVDTDGALGRAARDASEGDKLQTLTDGDGFDAVRNGEPGTTLAVPIPYGEGTVVLFAVYYDLAEPDTQNVDLFEILAAHAATALSSVDTAARRSDEPDPI
jgi:hypothetical protein